jgi:hypothetical protein
MIKYRFKLYKISQFGGSNNDIFNNIDFIINNIKDNNIKQKLIIIINDYKLSNKDLNDKFNESNTIIKNIIEDLNKIVDKISQPKIDLTKIGTLNTQPINTKSLNTKPLDPKILGLQMNRR